MPSSRDAHEFLEQYTQSRRFSLGVPRAVQIAADGTVALYLRSRGSRDPMTGLWRLDLTADAVPVQIADPGSLITGAERLTDDELTEQRRQRTVGAGITGYSATADLATVAFTVAGGLFVQTDASEVPRQICVERPVASATLNPAGTQVAYVRAGSMYVSDFDGHETLLAEAEGDTITWGLPDLVSAEEINRARGFWWSVDGASLLVTRVDTSEVGVWRLGDLSDPSGPGATVRYPQAGEPNADVSLHVLSLSGARVDVEWARAAFPYVVEVTEFRGAVAVLVQSRDQSQLRLLRIDTATGETIELMEQTGERWIEITPGTPLDLGGQLVRAVEEGDTRRLAIGAKRLTPQGLQVRAVIGVNDEAMYVSASAEDPKQTHLWRVTQNGVLQLTTEPGVHVGRVSSGGLTITSDTASGLRASVLAMPWNGSSREIPGAGEPVPNDPMPVFYRLTDRALECALLLPRSGPAADTAGSLPILLDPYGGPGVQRVTAGRRSYAISQWFADQGFAVVIIDGRGGPGRGVAWEHALDGDLAANPVQDQVDALQELAGREPRLDLNRVGVRGWSFGGYLALLLATRRPDLIKAAVAGASVTDWRLYDTYYSERYLGLPKDNEDAYDNSAVTTSTVADSRPALMLLHGLMDDNVHPANTVRFSERLTRSGWDHEVVYLPGAHHGIANPSDAVAVFSRELRFLRGALMPREVERR